MSAISFLASLGAGYLQGQDKVRDQQRQDRLDQITLDRAARETADYNESRANRDAVRAAAAPLPVEPIDGVGPPDENGATPRGGFRVGAQQFADQGVAAEAANDPTARDARVSAALNGINPVQAQQFDQGVKAAKLSDVELKKHIASAQTEGESRALSAALAGRPPEEVAAIFNAQGQNKISNVQITPIEVNHPVLGKQQSVRITGTNQRGEPFEIPDALDASFKLFSAEKQFDMLMKKSDADTKAKQDDRRQTREDKAADSLARYHDALAAASGERAAKTGSGKAADPMERMSEADKQEYLGIREQIKTINGEITKAQASDSWNGESANAKALNTRLAALNLRGRALLDRYADADTEAPDPLGLRKPPAPATRPRTSMELVQADMAKDGVKDATFYDKGQTITFGKGGGAAAMAANGVPAPAPAAAPVAAPPQATAPEIPPPPVPFLNGNRNTPNPAFVQWTNTYKMTPDQWQQMQDQKAQQAAEAQRAAAQAAVNAARGNAPVARGNV